MSEDSELPRPRCRPHTFAHMALRQVALQDGRKFVRMLALPDGPRLVRELWDEVGLRCAARGHAPPPGGDRPRLEARTLLERQAVVVVLPDALADEEARRIVILEDDGDSATAGVRYFVVERLGDRSRLTEWRHAGDAARRGVWGVLDDDSDVTVEDAIARSL